MTFDLDAWIKENIASRDTGWAWDHFERLLQQLILDTKAERILEIGGGRSPLLIQRQLPALRYTVMDVSQKELDLAPEGIEKIQGDISMPQPQAADMQADVIFSKMLVEHLPDVKTAYRNMYAMLRPGGVCFHFHPVLYSLPMYLNKIVPEALTSRLLRLFQPSRHEDGVPKFPAYYDYGKIEPRTTQMLAEIGFSRVRMQPFYGHSYYERFPPLRWSERQVREVMKRMNVKLLATNCFTVLQK